MSLLEKVSAELIKAKVNHVIRNGEIIVAASIKHTTPKEKKDRKAWLKTPEGKVYLKKKALRDKKIREGKAKPDPKASKTQKKIAPLKRKAK